MSLPSVITSVTSLVCTAAAFISIAAPNDPNDKDPCHFKRISLYHGSSSDAANIRLRPGLDPFRLPTWVSRDRAAAQNAAFDKYDSDPGNRGVFESRVPSVVFTTLFLPFEAANYVGFFPYIPARTQIQLSLPIQIELFNRYMVP